MRTVKAVRFYYPPTRQTIQLLSTFRDINAAINIERSGKIERRSVARSGARGIDEAMTRDGRPMVLIL